MITGSTTSFFKPEPNYKMGNRGFLWERILLRSIFFCLLFSVLMSFSALAQNTTVIADEIDAVEPDVAAVKVDGKILFFVRGISSYPAEKRAQTIGDRIYNVASDYSIPADSVFLIPTDDYVKIVVGSEFIMNVYEIDGKWSK